MKQVLLYYFVSAAVKMSNSHECYQAEQVSFWSLGPALYFVSYCFTDPVKSLLKPK